LGLILFLWYVNLVAELKDLFRLYDFLRNFPVDESSPLLPPHIRKAISKRIDSMTPHDFTKQKEDAEKEEDEGSSVGLGGEDSVHVIESISVGHRMMVLTILTVRFVLLLYMFHVGSTFLLTQHNYDDLLLNAVALAFIFELPEFLYIFLVSDEMKAKLEDAHTIEYVTSLPKQGHGSFLLSKALWGLVIIPLIVFMTVMWHYRATTLPAMQALMCTCYQKGSHCEVSQRFTRGFWDAYWKDVAAMFQQQFVYR